MRETIEELPQIPFNRVWEGGMKTLRRSYYAPIGLSTRNVYRKHVFWFRRYFSHGKATFFQPACIARAIQSAAGPLGIVSSRQVRYLLKISGARSERTRSIREEKRKTKPRRAGQPCLTVFVHLKSSVRPLDSLRGCSARWLEQIPLSSWENICLNFERRGLFMKGIEPSYRESGRMQMLGQSSEMGTPDAKGYF